MSLVRNQMEAFRHQSDSRYNESSLGDRTLRDIVGDRTRWPPLSSERTPWNLNEEAATKHQILEQADMIKNLKKLLEAANNVIHKQQKMEENNKGQDLAMEEGNKGQAQDQAMQDDNQSHSTKKISLPIDIVREMEGDYSGRCLIGLMFGPRPPMESLKKWVEDTWGPYGAQIKSVQVLPKGYYLFLFKDKEMALHILGAGQWMFRNSPFCLFRWSKEFTPSGRKPTKCPV